MMAQTLFVKKTYGTITAGSETEIVGSEYWSQVPMDKVLVIEEYGIFGDASLAARLLSNQMELIPRQEGLGTTVSRDYIQKLNVPVPPAAKLNIVVRNNHATTAYAPTIWLKGTLFDLDELGVE